MKLSKSKMVKYLLFGKEKCIEMRLSFLENRSSVFVFVVAYIRMLWFRISKKKKKCTHVVPNVITK